MFDYYKIIKIFDEDFDEEKHPRDKTGKFVKKSKESQKGHNLIKYKKYFFVKKKDIYGKKNSINRVFR